MLTFNTSLPSPFKINLGSQTDLSSSNPSINRKIQGIDTKSPESNHQQLSLPIPTPNLNLIWKGKEPLYPKPLNPTQFASNNKHPPHHQKLLLIFEHLLLDYSNAHA